MIYIFEDIYGLSDQWYKTKLRMLPPERQSKVLHYRCEIDRKSCIIAYILLCYGLRLEYKYDCNPRFSYNPYGKPYILQFPSIYFSFSHCSKGLTCAISDCEIGIDIQDQVSLDNSLLHNVCSEKEIAKLQESKHQDQLCMITAQELKNF